MNIPLALQMATDDPQNTGSSYQQQANNAMGVSVEWHLFFPVRDEGLAVSSQAALVICLCLAPQFQEANPNIQYSA